MFLSKHTGTYLSAVTVKGHSRRLVTSGNAGVFLSKYTGTYLSAVTVKGHSR